MKFQFHFPFTGICALHKYNSLHSLTLQVSLVHVLQLNLQIAYFKRVVKNTQENILAVLENAHQENGDEYFVVFFHRDELFHNIKLKGICFITINLLLSISVFQAGKELQCAISVAAVFMYEVPHLVIFRTISRSTHFVLRLWY